jgi:pimeloyl-ACP methyl ester carboxylesterase
LKSVLLALCVTGALSRAHAEAAPPPGLQAAPSADGLITWFLCSPATKEPLDKAVPPKNARAGDAVPGGGGKWSVLIAPSRFVDLRPSITARSGTVWLTTKIQPAVGGARHLSIISYCPVRIYQDARLVVDKARTNGRQVEEASAEIEVPKEGCELTVGVGLIPESAAFMLAITESRAQGGQIKPVAGDRILLPTEPGKAPDAGAALLASLNFQCRNTFVNEGQHVLLDADLPGCAPVGLGPLTARLLGPDGAAFGPALPPRVAADLSRAHWSAEYVVPARENFLHELTLEISAENKPLGTKKVQLFSAKGLAQEADRLQQDIEERAIKSRRAMPNAKFMAEKLKLFLTKLESGEEPLTRDTGPMLMRVLSSAKTCADAEETGRDPYENKSGYFERAYVSAIDNGAQPYLVHIPAAYAEWVANGKKEPKKFPLVVFLHGYVPSYDKHRWWDEMPEFNAVLDRNNCLLLIPFGRSNADFQASGEVDILDALAEFKKLHTVDEDRVYLYGYSMGGMGVYTVAAHNPDLFAAGIVFCGRADSPLQNFQPLDKFHPCKQQLILNDNPISLCENLRNIPLRIYHGRDDMIISPAEAIRMEERLKETGCDAKLAILPGNHWFGFEIMCTDEPVSWLLTQKRKANAEQRRIKSYSLRHARQNGVEILTTKNVLAPLELSWSDAAGAPAELKPGEAVGLVSIAGATPPPAGLHKSPRLCGPVREAACGPFTIVYGTTGSAEANARNKENAERFAKDWFVFSKSRAIVKADKDVSEEDKRSRNLFLFGEQQENALHAAAAAQLPIVVKDGQVALGGKTLPLRDRGIMYIYPSPFGAAQQRSVVVCAGVNYGEKVSSNHKLDLLPDFFFYEARADLDQSGTNRAIVAGFFDPEWKLDEKSTWWFDAAAHDSKK